MGDLYLKNVIYRVHLLPRFLWYGIVFVHLTLLVSQNIKQIELYSNVEYEKQQAREYQQQVTSLQRQLNRCQAAIAAFNRMPSLKTFVTDTVEANIQRISYYFRWMHHSGEFESLGIDEVGVYAIRSVDNRLVRVYEMSTGQKTKAARRDIPLPDCLVDCLKEAKAASTSEYVIANREGGPLSYTQFKRLWQYIVTRTAKERSYYRYEDGRRVKHTIRPVLGEKAAHNGKEVYSLDFEVTPHQLRHTYITNLIHASVDPKTVQYLAGHESSKITMDIYAKVKYNQPDELGEVLKGAFEQWNTAG